MFKSSPAENCFNSCTVDGISIHLHLRKREPQQQQHRSMASEEYYPKILHLQGSLGLWIAEVRHPSNRYLLHEQSIDEILFERNLADSNSSIRGFVRMICFVGSMYCGIWNSRWWWDVQEIETRLERQTCIHSIRLSDFRICQENGRNRRARPTSDWNLENRLDRILYAVQTARGRCLYEITTRISRSLRVLKTANDEAKFNDHRQPCVSFDLLFWSFFPRVSDRLCLPCPLKQWITPL